MRTTLLSVLAAFALLASTPVQAQDDTAANINVAFVTDLSGSMKSNNLVDPTRLFLNEFVQALLTGDRVILVSFGDNGWIVPPINISERNRDNDVAGLLAEIKEYEFTQNYTFTSHGLGLACSALKQQNGPKVLVLLTDGKEEIPPGNQPQWDNLPHLCEGTTIHVIALTQASMPTVKQVGDRLHATLHDATQKSLTEIGNEIREGIRVFVSVNNEKFDLGNLSVGESAETRATFTVSGASSELELQPSGEFPPGVNFSCPNFHAPGDMVCSVLLTDAVQPGAYTGKISFTSAQGNLAVVTPTIEVAFSRGLTNISVSESDISLGAMWPGETQAISIDFESGDGSAPQPITLSLSGFPDGMVTLEPATVMAPANDVELKLTFNSGDPGNYSGQLTLVSQSPTMQVNPAVIPVEFHRRMWYWENWKWTVPASVGIVLLLTVLYIQMVVVPRKREATRPLLTGRVEYPDGRVVQLKGQTQEINDFTFQATGTREETETLLISPVNLRVKRQRGGNIAVVAQTEYTLKHGDAVSTREGELLFTFFGL